MIYVDVVGAKSTRLKNKLIGAAYFYLKELKVSNRFNLDVVIRLTQMDVDGYCDYNYDESDKEITIELNKCLSDDELLLALAHEMVHAKQYVKKELRTVNGLNYWKGATFSQTKFVDNMVPWEQEAYNKEQHLRNQFYGK